MLTEQWCQMCTTVFAISRRTDTVSTLAASTCMYEDRVPFMLYVSICKAWLYIFNFGVAAHL